jgi:hypothetical protein
MNNVTLELGTIKKIAEENRAIGYKEIQGDITIWRNHDYLNGYMQYLTFTKTDNGYIESGIWTSTKHIPSNLISLDRLGD